MLKNLGRTAIVAVCQTKRRANLPCPSQAKMLLHLACFMNVIFLPMFVSGQETDPSAFSTLLHSPTDCIEEGRELLQNQLCPDTLRRGREGVGSDGESGAPWLPPLAGKGGRSYSENRL